MTSPEESLASAFSMLGDLKCDGSPDEVVLSLADACVTHLDRRDVVICTGALLSELQLPSLYAARCDKAEALSLVQGARDCPDGWQTGWEVTVAGERLIMDVFRPGEQLEVVLVARNQPLSGEMREAVGELIRHFSTLLAISVGNAIDRLRLDTLERATRTARIGYSEWQVGSSRMKWDQQMMDIFAVERDAFSGQPEEFTERLHPGDREDLLAGIQAFVEHATDGDAAEFTFRIIDALGETRKLVAHAALRQNFDGSHSLVGTNYDISELERARAQTLFRSELEQLLLQLSMKVILASGDSVDKIMEEALRDVGQFVGADRAYRFDYDFNEGESSNTHEWCAEGIEPEIDNLQQVPIDAIPFWVNAHRKGLPFYKSRLDELPVGHGLREILDPQGVQSIVTIPLMRGDECLGFIGFDSVRTIRHWTDTEISVLQILAQLMVNAQIKAENERQLSAARTALRESRDHAHKLAEEAVSANEAKSRFIASVSHELRTPLHVIIGLTEMVRDQPLSNAARDRVDSIHTSGSVLLELINDILDYSRIESGGLEIHQVRFDLMGLLDSLIDGFQGEAERRQLSLRLIVDVNVPTKLSGDPLRIRQILNNLIGNALKFTPRGGVTVRVSRDSSMMDEAVHVVRFCVQDSGIGISQEDQAQIFEPFFQGDDTDSRRYSGTGMGLSIVGNLVGLMNGQISVQSELGRGSEFTVTLPFSSRSVATEEAEVAEPWQRGAASLHGARVLLAEDNPMNRQLVELYLEASGCDLEMVQDGEELLQALRRASADVVLMDCQMPVMDGFTATRVLRASDSAFSDIPVIAVTANAQEDTYSACMAAGFNDILIKPFSKSALHEKLYMWLPSLAQNQKNTEIDR